LICEYDGYGLSLILLCPCLVVVCFVLLVEVYAVVYLVIGKVVYALAADCYSAGCGYAANLIAEIKQRNTRPKTAVDLILVWLIESTVIVYAWEGF